MPRASRRSTTVPEEYDMKLTFDEEKWHQLQEDLNVAQLCGENAGKVYAFAKGALQRAVAAIVGEKDVSAADAAHALEMLKKLRNGSADAAQGYQAATATIDEMIRHLEPASVRVRRRA
jgi:hypothetical protein